MLSLLFAFVLLPLVTAGGQGGGGGAAVAPSQDLTVVINFYTCGTGASQYFSQTPCQNQQETPQRDPCNTCQQQQPQCKYRCQNNRYCRRFNEDWSCEDGCCKKSNRPGRPDWTHRPRPTTTPAPTTTSVAPTQASPQPVCGGREISGGYCQTGRCGTGFLCTSESVCCRCSYGTSIGECVNNMCPEGFMCNSVGQCCPYQVREPTCNTCNPPPPPPPPTCPTCNPCTRCGRR